MKKNLLVKVFGLFLGFLLVLAMPDAAAAQGKSKGKGKGKTKVSSGEKEKPGKKDDKSGKSNRNDDEIYGDDDDRSNNNRDRVRERRPHSKRFNGLARKIGMDPEEAESWYEKESDRNPDLTYGQFVAANMIARKHGGRNQNLTARAILDRLDEGENFGQAVKGLGLKGKDYDRAKKDIRRDFEDRELDDVDSKTKDIYDYRIGW